VARNHGGMRRGHTGQRRLTDWLGSGPHTTATALAAASVVLDQSFTGAQVDALTAFTIIRTVGLIGVRSDQVAADEFILGAVGGMVVRETARAGGVGNVPTPITEVDDDGWFLL